GNHSWYVPIAHRYLGAPDQLPQDAVLAAVGPALAAADKKRLVHGRKEASLTLRRAGLPRLAVDLDVEIVSYLVDATKYEHSLENIALDHLESKLPAAPNEIARGRESWEQGTVSEARDYALARVEAIYAVAPILLTDLKAGAKGSISRLEELYRQVELPLSDVLADVESAGIRIDPSVMQALSREFGEKATRMERTCHELAGGPFNVGSPKQLSDVLFNRLGLPVIKKTKTGASTDASVLDQLLDQHEIVPTILQWRSITKLKGTYTDVLPTLINPETKRIHTNFRQALAATGRLSSFDPNLQNIPSRTEEGRRIREAFVPAEGCVLLSADYSQIELRLLAHLSGDPGLTAAFRDREDIHTRTAAEVFGLKTDEVTRDQRSAAKAINFGLMYGMSAFRLARDLHITRPEAQSYMDRYFERYASVKNYIDETLQFGRDNGYVETLLGRRRYVPELTSRNFTRRGAAERAAMNMPVQGTAADVIKLAMLRVQSALREQGLKATMLLQVHDELVFDVPHDELEVVTKLVVDRMETAYPISVPMDVSVSSGPNWNEAH
ncbi:MAG: DNA polymerase-1, partial [Myxococcota bacterium]